MASSKEQLHPPPACEAGPPSKRIRPDTQSNPIRVGLNPADCGLDFDVESNGLRGHALHEQGFAYCWSGARANIGIRKGKYCFGCKIVSEQTVDMSETPSNQQHLCRVGISRGDDPVGNLGETLQSFGFGGTGKFSNAGKFTEYGAKFGVGDTVVCAVDLENRPLATIGFSLNGKWLGVAQEFDLKGFGITNTNLTNRAWESAIYPHVLLKNVVVDLQFSREDGLVPADGYKPWSDAIEDGDVIIGPQFSRPKDCEVLMMVGLPASGKTTWAERWVKEYPEKRYVLLGTNLALDLMKVPGLLRKNNYGERFELLMDRATGIFNTLLARAAQTPRNYILDQTNVYKSARNRKLQAFVNYRKVAVVIFPKLDELKIRAEKRFKEMGKEVPQDAVNQMLANYILPTSKDMRGTNEVFDELIFPELSRDEAQRLLNEMKGSLQSPKSNTKTTFLPYSRESSFRSNSGPAVIDREITSGHRPTSRPVFFHPCQDNLSSTQFNPVFSGSISVEQSERSCHERSSPYGSYMNYGTTPFQRDDMDLYGRYEDCSPYIRMVSERSFSSYPLETHSAHMHNPMSSRDGFESQRTDIGTLGGPGGYTYQSDPRSYSSSHAYPQIQGVPFGRHNQGADRYEWRDPNQSNYEIHFPAHPTPRPPPGTPSANIYRESWNRLK